MPRRSRSRSRSRRRSRRRRSGGAKEEKRKVFTRVDKNCKDLGGEYRAKYPSQAAPKVGKPFFKQSDNGKTVRVYFRQKTPGPGHNDVWAYDVTQKLVPATEWDIKNRDYPKGSKKAQRKAKFVKHVPAVDNCKGLP